MSNFDFLLAEKDFDCFSNIAISAEKLFLIDPESSVIKCRKAMEIAIKWMYSIDRDLKKPIWDDKLVSLMNEQCFKDIVPPDLHKRLDYIRLLGNSAVHSVKERERIKPEAALLCLENLHSFMDFIAYCYARFDYDQTVFDPALISNNQSAVSEKESKETELEEKLQALLKENEALKSELTAKREEQQQTYVAKPLDISEFETRRLYIDVMLERAGWRKKKNCIEEYEVYGMPNQSGKGYVDYALLGDDNKVLAIVEAKKTCKDLAAARQQAEIYANLIEKVQGRKPVIFLTNGFETRIIDGCYPERRISEIYSKRDLEKLFNLRITKQDLRQAKVNSKIANRYYQKEAIIATCDVLSSNRRKALLVMATGSGKTRTVIALCDILLNNGWVKNILFLADRTALVNQAKNSFVALMPNLSVVNLCDDKENYTARCVFSTYNTMMNCIDTAQDEEGRLFTSGHFDLIICDEAHRSIYNKYKDIFDYFDAPLVGLTATPKDEIDKNTYSVFDLQSGMPTYAYELKQAVKDGFLVDYKYADTKLKFLEEGIKYDDLSPEEQEEFEKTFVNEDGEQIKEIDSSALNSWVFNKDTIRQVLDILMNKGHRVDYGNKLGKTIIFAKNHNHAEEIFKVFNEEYPHLNGYAEVIDNYSKKPDLAIEQFKIGNKLPQIAISVDMLDTGIDVPEVVNLVFFKKVRSKAKFHQMIGRGTRLCPKLLMEKIKKTFIYSIFVLTLISLVVTNLLKLQFFCLSKVLYLK